MLKLLLNRSEPAVPKSFHCVGLARGMRRNITVKLQLLGGFFYVFPDRLAGSRFITKTPVEQSPVVGDLPQPFCQVCANDLAAILACLHGGTFQGAPVQLRRRQVQHVINTPARFERHAQRQRVLILHDGVQLVIQCRRQKACPHVITSPTLYFTG